MKRKLCLATVCLVSALTSLTRAEDAVKTALSAIPADAVGFVLVPNVEKLDANFQQVITDLGLNVFLQPPNNSLQGLLGANLGMTQGLDASGCLAVVLMPFETAAEIWAKAALLVPTADPKALLEGMGGVAGEGGSWTVNVMGMPWQAVVGKNRVVLAQSPEIAKAVADSKKGMDKRLKSVEVKGLQGLDFAIWIDGEHLVSTFGDNIEQFFNMMVAMQQAGGAMGLQAEANKQNLQRMMDGTRSGTIGLSLGSHGLGLRLGLTTKSGSELAKQWKMKSTTDSLLRGVPADGYLVAFGQTIQRDQIKESLKNLDYLFTGLKEEEGADAEQVDRLKSSLEKWAVLFAGLRGSLVATPPGPDGLFAVNLIVDTPSSKKWLQGFGELFSAVKNLSTDNDDFKEAMGYLSHNAEAEEIAGVKIQEFKMDVFRFANDEELDEEEIESIAKIIGKEGLVLRMGALDKKTVVMGLGGSGRMTQLIEQARSDDAPLDQDEGIKRVNAYLPKDRAQVGYIALDRIVVLAKNVMEAIDEEMPPLPPFPPNAPLAMVVAGGDGWIQFEILLPTELMVAGKNTAMMLMMSRATAAGAQEQPGGPGGEQPPPPTDPER